MATTLQLPAFPRHGILLNSSPSTSPYSHTTSLPGTPHLISSLSSLSSSASSTSPHNSDADNYFQTYSTFGNPYVAPQRSTQVVPSGSTTLSRDNSTKKPASAPQTRKIRFAPLPEPRRDELSLPDVFLDDSVENLDSFPNQESVETPRSNPNSRPSSLLFSGPAPVDVQAPSSSDITPTTSNLNLQLGAGYGKRARATLASSSTSGSDKEDSDWDHITTPLSPNAMLSSSAERLPQSCPESPLSRRTDLPREKKSLTKKLLKPLLGRNIATEDVLTLGVNQLFRSSTRESDDGSSSGATTPAGYSTPSRNRSKERTGSVSDGECGFGAPLCRSSSDNTAMKKGSKHKMSFLNFSNGNSSLSDASLWRTQSAGDMRRVQSRDSERDVKRPRSGSTNEPYGPRKQLRMLNGRVYGAKRSNLGKTNLFASARSEEPEFVEWGYGGMGSVKTAASVGADNKWSRVTGSSAIGANAGEAASRGSSSTDPDDDGGGMSWVKKRREQREREKKEAEHNATKEAAEKENHDVVQPHAEVADPDPPSAEPQTVEEPMQEEAQDEPEHITTAVTLPAHHRPMHHHSRSMERVPSSASHTFKAPERRDSEDTARAVSPPVAKALLADVEQVVGEMDDDEVKSVIRSRRESQSSTNSAESSSVGTDDEDADAEDSVKGAEDDEDESEDDEVDRRTALGAGVEKVSRHKEKSHSQDGAVSS